MDDDAGTPKAVGPPPRLRALHRAVQTWPLTTGLALCVLVTGAASGALWRAAEDTPWYPYAAYGAPSLENGRLWTFLSGTFFAASPWQYLPVLGGLIFLVGLGERLIGTGRSAVVFCAGQLGATLLAAGLVLGLRSGWTWAAELARQLDTGLSAGALATGAAASAALRAPWRLRLRIGLAAYAVIWLLYSGTLTDVEHFFAVALGLAAGRAMVPAAIHGSGRASRREWRLLAVSGLLVIAVTLLVVRFFPAQGPVGSTEGLGGGTAGLLLSLLVIAVLANGLRRGMRSSWWWAVLFALLNVLLGLFIAAVIIIGEITGLESDVRGLPVLVPHAVIWAAELGLLLAGKDAFRTPPRRRRNTPHAISREEAAAILMLEGGTNLSWMTTWPENSYLPVAAGHGYVAYRVHARTAIALGDPVGAAAHCRTALEDFDRMCGDAGLTPCVFSAARTTAEQAQAALGWRYVQVAEDTVIDLEALEFRGKAWQGVRSSLNRAGREGITYRLTSLSREPHQVVSQARAISEEWVGDMGLPEMGFTLGGIDEALDANVLTGLAEDEDGRLHGVTSWLPVYGPGRTVKGWVLDVMRRRKDGFPPVVEFMIASTCTAMRDRGATYLSLSGAPLARTSQNSDDSPASLERFLDQLGAALEPYYGFRSLHTFKAKFQPRYEPMYMIYRDQGDLPRIGSALTRAFMPHSGLRDFIHLTTKST
ncbi:phosphatidylglycerol lysyltransferase domain-containing protein [Streptomyces sp. NPDC008121]|uniref:bifunctional lysylphosphatidylglycerol flippase/synthetase MprF n=1 Tax=Streptomyces sp. NPDC008121 TaxID=3364809 RepID=UPI0036EB61AA